MSRCKFCDDFRAIVEMNDALDGNHSTEKTRLRSKYLLRLVVDTYKDGKFAGRSEFWDYEIRHCPVCGKKIEK